MERILARLLSAALLFFIYMLWAGTPRGADVIPVAAAAAVVALLFARPSRFPRITPRRVAWSVAYGFYLFAAIVRANLDVAGRIDNPAIAEVFLEFAAEELGHKALLEEVRSGRRTLRMRGGVADLRLADHYVAPKPTGEMGYQDALLIAIKREVGAITLYDKLSNRPEDDDLRSTFAALAEEERRHKLRLETIYDDAFMRED